MTATDPCLQHATNPVTSFCVRCGRSMCDLCTFWVGSALFCPECLGSGPSADERSSVAVKGILSVGLGVLGVVAIGLMLMGGALFPDGRVAELALGFLCLGLTLGGITLGLIGREGAARTGSMLPILGVIINAVLLALYGVFSLIGTFS